MDNLQVGYQEIKSSIKRELNSVAESFVVIGYNLKRIRDEELYTVDGYNNINEFAKAEYSLSQSTTSRFIAINDKYSVDGSSPRLLEKFDGYGYSKLSEMLTMAEDELDLVSIQTTRAEMRDIKQAKKEYENQTYAPAHNPESIDFTQSDSNFNGENIYIIDDANVLLIDFFRSKDRRSILKELAAELKANYGNITDIGEKAQEIINPSGHQYHRKGITMMILEGETISINRFGKEPLKISYSDLVHDIVLTFDMTQEDPWVAFYGEPEPDPVVEEETMPEEEKIEPIKTKENKEEREPEVHEQLDTEEYPDVKVTVDGVEIEPQHDETIEAEYPSEVSPDIEEDLEVIEADIVDTKSSDNECDSCRKMFPRILITENYYLEIISDGYIEINTQSKQIDNTDDKIKINYCPICGRPFNNV